MTTFKKMPVTPLDYRSAEDYYNFKKENTSACACVYACNALLMHSESRNVLLIKIISFTACIMYLCMNNLLSMSYMYNVHVSTWVIGYNLIVSHYNKHLIIDND